MNLNIIAEAQDDIAVAALWYENERKGLGEGFINAVEKSLRSITKTPLLYPVKRQGCRAALLKKFPFVIYYKIFPDSIIIVTVLHTAKSPESWIDRIS